MVEVFVDGVGASTSKTIVENLLLPGNLVNTNNRFCNVIEVTYDLKIEAETSGCHTNFEMIFPIVIGTVPLNMGQQGQFTQLPISEFTDNTNQMPYKYPSAPMPNAPMPSAPIANGFSNPKVDLRKFFMIQSVFLFSFQIIFTAPPSFDEALKMIHEKVNSNIAPNPSIGFGWNVAQPPSAPAEK